MDHFFPNGVRLLVRESHSAPVAAVQVWVKFGSADEPEKFAGAAHLMEHMIFKGDGDPGGMAREIEAAGGDINAWTSFDETVYHLALPKEELATGVDVLLEAVKNPVFLEEDLDSEKKVILEELGQGKDDPGHLCIENIFKQAFRKHPYGRPIIGFCKTLREITAGDLKALHNSHYSTKNITVVIAGDVNPRKCCSLVGKKMKGFEAKKPKKSRIALPEQKELRISLAKTPDINEIHIALGFHIPGLRHEDTPALDLLAVILGQGESSRLHSRLKKDAQLVTDVFAHAYTLKDSGLFVLAAGIPPDRFAHAMTAVLDELFAVSKLDVTDEELKKAVGMAMSEKVYAGETVQGLARKTGYYGVTTGDPEFEDKYLDRIRMLKKGELLKTAKKYLKPESLTISVVIPEKPAQGSSKILSAPDGKKRTWLKKLVAKKTGVPSAKKLTSTLKPAGAGIYKYNSTSGARVLIMPDPSVPVTAFRAVWLGGLRAETASNNGISNLLAGMLSRGSSRFPGNEGIEKIESMGGGMSGTAGRNTVGLRAESLSEYWAEAFEIIADTLMYPLLEQTEIEKERKTVLDEIKTREDNPAYQAYRIFRKALYRNHPYGMSIQGEEKSLKEITSKQLRSFQRRFMRPQDGLFCVVGDVDPNQVADAVEEFYFAKTSSPGGKIRERKVPEISRPKDIRVRKQRKQAHIVVGFKGLTISDKKRFAMEVLTAALAGQGGRLFHELRDKKGMAYHVSANNIEGLDPGFLSVYMATSPEKISEAVSGIRIELEKIRNKALSSSELKDTKNRLAGNHAISLQRRSALAGSILLNELYGLGSDEHTKYREKILSVTADDVQALARTVLNPEREILAVVSPNCR